MASTSCCRCLSRPSVIPTSLGVGNVSSRLPSLAAFSTSSRFAATIPKKPKLPAAQQKKGKTLKIKKKAVVKSGRPPAPGERKALRKRIVLSNTNALDVPNMVDMTPEAVLDSAQTGKILGLPGILVDQLRAVEAFKTTQGWGMFRRPATLVRKETVEVAKMMQAAQEGKKTAVSVIDGGRGTGKSLMLLQAMAIAFTNRWIVLNIPEAQELTRAATDYSLLPGTTPRSYSQSSYTANWLSQIGKANNAVLSKMEITQKHTLPIPLQSNITLARLVELGARDADIAWPVFQAFWSEITSKERPPILLTLDGLSHIMRDSAYRSPEYELIHAHDLAPVGFFVDYLSGTKQLPNGGAVLAATSKGNTPASYALSLALKQLEERQSGKELTKPDPFQKLDVRSLESLQAATLMNLKGLSREEARGLMEYWAASGILRQRVDEQTVSEKWTLAGHGVIGEIERGTLRMTL
ncbi:MAG: 37S ribosomal protein S23 mitochondrial [Claussenomyces sp. TS43310]|nr:MAG: 37S ribosomal protein S23 mitochondrial [Claussenomyces sp. TS43310]